MAAGPSRDPLAWSNDACSRSSRRIQQELKELSGYKDAICSAGPRGDDLYDWVAALPGPEDTPYHGGTRHLSLFGLKLMLTNKSILKQDYSF